MTRSDRLWCKNYSYSQNMRYEDTINITSMRSKEPLVRKLNRTKDKINNSLEPIKNLYRLLGE